MFESRYDALRRQLRHSDREAKLMLYSFNVEDIPVYVVREGLLKSAQPVEYSMLNFPFNLMCLEIVPELHAERMFIFIAKDTNSDAAYLMQRVMLSAKNGRVLPGPPFLIEVTGDSAYLTPISDKWVRLRGETQDFFKGHSATGLDLLSCFVALVGVKGIVTETVEPPAALNKKRLKHGKAPLRPYILVKVGKVYDRHGSEVPEGERRTVTPHIRAGHSRMQPYGPRSTLRKPVFIPPTFVNYVDGVEAQNRPRIVTL